MIIITLKYRKCETNKSTNNNINVFDRNYIWIIYSLFDFLPVYYMSVIFFPTFISYTIIIIIIIYVKQILI